MKNKFNMYIFSNLGKQMILIANRFPFIRLFIEAKRLYMYTIISDEQTKYNLSFSIIILRIKKVTQPRPF